MNVNVDINETFAFRGHSTTMWTECCHFLTPHPLRGQFLYPERGQKQTFFDTLPPHSVHVVIEWPLNLLNLSMSVNCQICEIFWNFIFLSQHLFMYDFVFKLRTVAGSLKIL